MSFPVCVTPPPQEPSSSNFDHCPMNPDQSDPIHEFVKTFDPFPHHYLPTPGPVPPLPESFDSRPSTSFPSPICNRPPLEFFEKVHCKYCRVEKILHKAFSSTEKSHLVFEKMFPSPAQTPPQTPRPATLDSLTKEEMQYLKYLWEEAFLQHPLAESFQDIALLKLLDEKLCLCIQQDVFPLSFSKGDFEFYRALFIKAVGEGGKFSGQIP